jgi:hypothetical protein
MQAIQTKHRPATATRGARILAQAPGGHKEFKTATLREACKEIKFTSYTDEVETLHRLAALNLAMELGWGWSPQTMVTGWLPNEVLAHVSTKY